MQCGFRQKSDHRRCSVYHLNAWSTVPDTERSVSVGLDTSDGLVWMRSGIFALVLGKHLAVADNLDLESGVFVVSNLGERML